MKRQIATTKEQSDRLLKCGVKPETADMCHIFFSQDGEQISQEEWLECDPEIDRGESYLIPKDFGMYDYSYSDNVPAWSLSALLALLPIDLMWQGLYYRLVMGPNERRWEIEYNNLSVINNLHRVIADTPIEACVQMIEWLTSNKYKLNEI